MEPKRQKPKCGAEGVALREQSVNKRYFRAGSVLKKSRSTAGDGAGAGGFQKNGGLMWDFFFFKAEKIIRQIKLKKLRPLYQGP